ncbi:3-hydroxyacyl-ACP dehydratase [Streptomyces sp. NPDC046887]|uniref:3-hydroxyacyl-ACP dehydratase n=1 Tax=Streptomyces sp. NPDC046887 TaxID=3155472 RepID=UPI0033F9A10F
MTAAGITGELARSLRAAHQAALRTHESLQQWLLAAEDRPSAGPEPSAGGTALRATVDWNRQAGPSGITGLRVVPARSGQHRWELRQDGSPVAEVSGRTGAAALRQPWPDRTVPCPEDRFHPLVRTGPRDLGRGDLALLAEGAWGSVFGPAFQPADSPEGGTGWTGPVDFSLLDDVTLHGPGAGRYRQGRVRATVAFGVQAPETAVACLLSATWQALAVHALHLGLQLCLPRPSLIPWTGEPTHVEMVRPGSRSGPLTLTADIARAGLVPRPHVVADVCVTDAEGHRVARLHAAGCELREPAGTVLAPAPRGRSPRRDSTGEGVYAHELHMAHAAAGDLGVTYGASAHRSAGLVRPRLPSGGMRMLHRMADPPGERGTYPVGSAYTTEYDVPEQPWYLRDNAGTVPHLAYLEVSLQAAAFVGAALGASTEYPDEAWTVRNLEGRARLLRHADLRGRTVRQRTTLLAHTPLPGAVLQRYGYRLAVSDEACYEGEAVHGFFTLPVLAEQQGMDAGRRIPPWLRRQDPSTTRVRSFDAECGDHPARGRLAFLAGAEAEFVPGGGLHGLGYLLCSKPVDPDDWYFGRHFLGDPVMPGSCGIEMLVQMTGACLSGTGAISGDRLAELRPLPGAELRWTYRGQIQPHHREVQAEVHLREVVRDQDGLTVRAEGSVWRDGLRVYAVDGIALRAPARPEEEAV